MAKKSSRTAHKASRTVNTAADRIKDTWESTLSALTAAEQEVERQIRTVLKRNKIGPQDAAAALKDLGERFEKERKKAAKELEGRLGDLQDRVQKERKSLGKRFDEAVHGTLATLNIPSRKEISDLTRKVDELTRKIDGFRKTSVAKGQKTARKASAAVASRLR
jgi:poly(hydroxyalkanoate) granule-associated protein